MVDLLCNLPPVDTIFNFGTACIMAWTLFIMNR
jgi:hypothetical protein